MKRLFLLAVLLGAPSTAGAQTILSTSDLGGHLGSVFINVYRVQVNGALGGPSCEADASISGDAEVSDQARLFAGHQGVAGISGVAIENIAFDDFDRAGADNAFPGQRGANDRWCKSRFRRYKQANWVDYTISNAMVPNQLGCGASCATRISDYLLFGPQTGPQAQTGFLGNYYTTPGRGTPQSWQTGMYDRNGLSVDTSQAYQDMENLIRAQFIQWLNFQGYYFGTHWRRASQWSELQ